MTQAAHAFFAPSSFHRLLLCDGSAGMEAQFDDLSDETARREGTACHEVMEHVLAGRGGNLVGELATNGVEITAAMLEAAYELRDDIAAKLGPAWASMIIVEKPVWIRRVHPTLSWGTPDVRAWVRRADGGWTLYVWDLKFGFKYVEAFENAQLTGYACGAMEEYDLRDQLVDCVLTVVQPRAYHPLGTVRTWAVPATDLRNVVNLLAGAAERASGPNPKCTPQPAACRDCRARSGCGALQEATYLGMDISRQATPRVLSDEALGLELSLIRDVKALIEARESGLEELVKAKLSRGSRIPFWRFGPGQGSTKWTKPAAEVALLGSYFGLDLKKPMEVVTPLQAIAKGMPEERIKPYSQTVTGATKLTRDDGTNVRRIFSRN